MREEIHPVTPERWRDLERLFGPRGAYGNCWCMFRRLRRRDLRSLSGNERKAALRATPPRAMRGTKARPPARGLSDDRRGARRLRWLHRPRAGVQARRLQRRRAPEPLDARDAEG